MSEKNIGEHSPNKNTCGISFFSDTRQNNNLLSQDGMPCDVWLMQYFEDEDLWNFYLDSISDFENTKELKTSIRKDIAEALPAFRSQYGDKCDFVVGEQLDKTIDHITHEIILDVVFHHEQVNCKPELKNEIADLGFLIEPNEIVLNHLIDCSDDALRVLKTYGLEGAVKYMNEEQEEFTLQCSSIGVFDRDTLRKGFQEYLFTQYEQDLKSSSQQCVTIFLGDECYSLDQKNHEVKNITSETLKNKKESQLLGLNKSKSCGR